MPFGQSHTPRTRIATSPNRELVAKGYTCAFANSGTRPQINTDSCFRIKNLSVSICVHRVSSAKAELPISSALRCLKAGSAERVAKKIPVSTAFPSPSQPSHVALTFFSSLFKKNACGICLALSTVLVVLFWLCERRTQILE